jgi:hypothetical protein
MVGPKLEREPSRGHLMLEVIAASFAAAAVCDTGHLLVPSGVDHGSERGPFYLMFGSYRLIQRLFVIIPVLVSQNSDLRPRLFV